MWWSKHGFFIQDRFLSQLPWLRSSILNGPWPTISSSCRGDYPPTPPQPGASPLSIADEAWSQEGLPEAGSGEAWPPPDGAGSAWMKLAGAAPWSTGWRWTACTCCGCEAATRRATASTVRRCTCTPHLRQVRKPSHLCSHGRQGELDPGQKAYLMCTFLTHIY